MEDISPVEIVRDDTRWAGLPLELREAFDVGVETVTRLRADIGAKAKVLSMPLVRILDELWFSTELQATASGRATFIHINGTDHAAVELPASTILCADELAIRLVLVHEFAHCFYFQRLILDLVDSGADPTEIPTDHKGLGTDETDRLHLPDPWDWFGDEDAKAFAYWGDSRMTVTDERIVALKLFAYFPVTAPQLGFQTECVGIEDDVVEHIRRLRVARL